MAAALTWLIAGLGLGLGAGLSPGPLFALVVARAAAHGWRGGAVVALAPLITDLPIAAVAILLLARLPAAGLALLSLVGGIFLLYLAAASARSPLPVERVAHEPGVLRANLAGGVIVNVLNPHPYLFWILVGAPTVAQAAAGSAGGAIGFIGGFYAALVASKVALAIVVDRAAGLLGGPAHRALVLASAAVMLWLGVRLIVEGSGPIAAGRALATGARLW